MKTIRTTLLAVLLAVLLAACGGDDSPGAADGPAGATDARPGSLDGWLGDGALPGRDAPPAPTCTTTVTTAAELATAVGTLGPGVTLCLAPGTYTLAGRLSLGADRSGTAEAPAVIAAAGGRGTVLVDAGGAEEAFFLSGATHLQIRGLEITGGAYHGVKIDPPSGDILIADSVFHDNTRAGEAGQYSDIKGCCLVARVTIVECEFYQGLPFDGDNYQAVDCNGCKAWRVARSLFRDVRGAGYAVAIQFKSGSADTIIERNTIRNCGIGINLGGFGTPAWGEETHEHVRGIVRNNVVTGSADAGISVLDAQDGKVYGNTLFANGFTPDVRRDAVNLLYRNNILDRPLNLRDGTTATHDHNLVLASPDDGNLFVAAAAGDFHLIAGAATAIDLGADLGADLPEDLDGEARPRGGGWDIGADER